MPPLPKSDFFGLDAQTWLFTGAESPLHRTAKAAVEEYLHHRTQGPDGRTFNARIESSCRAKLAQLLRAQTAEIALLSNASEGISSVLAALRLQAGENIVLHALEYPSAVLASLSLQERGIEVRVVPHQQWQVSPEAIMSRVDARTRLVITSHVSYLSGTRFDYQDLFQRLQATSTLLLLDATQSMGVVPVSLGHADFVVSSSYKWLLGMHGAGVLGVNPLRTSDIVPAATGWRSVPDLFSPHRFTAVERYHDARRFEVGYPAFATLAALNATLGVLLDCGIERIEHHVSQLNGQLIQGLANLGLEVMTPLEPHHRAGNIAFVFKNGEVLAQRLLERKILIWGGDGRARLSVHGFNDEADIEKALQEIKKVVSA